MSCANQWSDSGDRELDLRSWPAGAVHSESSGHTSLTGASHRSDLCRLVLSFAQVNVWVSTLLSRVAAISNLGQFGAR
jgi:hypothetical protein